MRHLIDYVACTVDGSMARTDGRIDFALPSGDHYADLVRMFPETFPGHLRGALDVTAPNQVFDCVLMGRATYDLSIAIGVTSPYPHLRQYVFSRTLERSPDPQVELVRDNPLATVRALKRTRESNPAALPVANDTYGHRKGVLLESCAMAKGHLSPGTKPARLRGAERG